MLETDLDAYQDARQRFPFNKRVGVCPWLSSDSFPVNLTEDARKRMVRLELPAWTRHCPMNNFDSIAETRCDMCSRLMEVIRCLGFKPDIVEIESFLVLEPITLLPHEIKLVVEQDNLEYEWLTLKFFKKGCCAKQIQSTDVSTSNSSVCLDKLVSCLSECVQTHSKCQQGSNDGWVPTRLVDTKEFNRSGTIRVVGRDEVLHEQLGNHVRYLALSHVWGDHDFLTLNTSNIQELRSGFPASQLPRTFRDAIAVTSQTRVRYRWVDSLCIIQDSETDWSSEAALMDKVYLNSVCNIASSLSTRPEEGLFWDRNLTIAGPFTVQFYTCPYTTQFDVFLDLQYLILNKAPLYKRGWVLQESHLSPRTMHFSRFPAFECRECFACELYRTSGHESVSRGENWLFHTSKTVFNKDSFGYTDWYDIVFDYSRCELTVSTDKLIALGGITKALSSVFPGSYYGGIWSEWWLLGLLWMVDQWLSGYEMSPLRLNDEYIAPSWSWASVNAPIQPWSPLDAIKNKLVNLVSFHTIPKSGNPFGQLISRELVLKGKLFHLPSLKALAELDRSILAAYTFSLDDCGDHFHDKATIFIPLVDSPGISTFDRLTICGLLLQAVGGGVGRQNAFQRVGFAVVSHVDGNVADSGYHLEN